MNCWKKNWLANSKWRLKVHELQTTTTHTRLTTYTGMSITSDAWAWGYASMYICTFGWLCLFSLFLHFAARCGSIKIAPVSATNDLEEVEYATTKHRYLSVCVCVFRRPCSTAIFAQNLLATALGQMNDSCCLQAVFVIDMVIVSKLYAFRLSTEKTMGKYLQSNFRLPAIWETCRCFKANTKCNWSMQNQSQPLFWHE